MLDLKHFLVIAGQEVVDEIRKLRNKTPMRDLVAHQVELARLGYRGAELVKSYYGWSVRADSGLQDFALLAGIRMGNVDGSYESAELWAIAWQIDDPAHRYVWRRRDPTQSRSI